MGCSQIKKFHCDARIADNGRDCRSPVKLALTTKNDLVVH
jgi:hypothetical protein